MIRTARTGLLRHRHPASRIRAVPTGHRDPIDHRLYSGRKSIMGFEIREFLRKVLIDRLLYTLLQKLRMSRTVEIPVVISRFVQDAHVALRRRLPLDKFEEWFRVGLKHGRVTRDFPIHGSAPWKNNAGRIVSDRCEYVMNQPSKQAPVPVFEWMHVDEPERNRGGQKLGIDAGVCTRSS